jgi:hypothetical protein
MRMYYKHNRKSNSFENAQYILFRVTTLYKLKWDNYTPHLLLILLFMHIMYSLFNVQIQF